MPKKNSKRIQRISEAQAWLTFLIGGVHIKRIPFGKEPEGFKGKCSCGVRKGQLHCLGCSGEVCCSPDCGMIAFSCSCESFLD